MLGCPGGAPQSVTSAAVGVAAAVDVEDVDGAVLVVDAVADTVLASTGPPLPFEGLAQRMA